MYGSLILATVLYIILFWVRSIQGGWEFETKLFTSERLFLDQKISQLLPSPQAELLSGILLGNKKDLPIGLKLNLRDTSTIHMVVVSGQNLSMVAGFFMLLSGLIKRKLAIALSFSAIILYTLLTGLQVPVLRAAIMVSVGFLAQMVGREKDSSWILILTGGLMLLINPGWLIDISFQLSFLATFGVIVVAPILLRRLNSVPIVSQDLAISLAAQIMVMPVIVQNFHQISLVGLLANLLTLWTIPFIMILGSFMLVVSFISVFLGSLVALGVNVLLTYFIYIVQFFASLPFAWQYLGEQLWVVWIGYYLIVSGVLFMLSLNNDQTKDLRASSKSS